MRQVIARLGHVFWVVAVITVVLAVLDGWKTDGIAIGVIAGVLGYVCSGIPFRS